MSTQDNKITWLARKLPTKGFLAWEYNPFRNLRISEDTEIDNKTILKKGTIVDFDTDLLSFSLNNPVSMIPQYSYDGSVNLILNDGINIPKLINSRFSAINSYLYLVVDRSGNSDTNLYDTGKQFDTLVSLYKKCESIPELTFLGTSGGGNMPVGNYHFYFKLMDADGNTTDFIAESGLVSVFIGDTPQSIKSGFRDLNSNKNVSFRLSNLDSSYPYVEVYYTRATSDPRLNFVKEAKRVDKKYTINNVKSCNILITGLENLEDIALSDINMQYNVVDSAYTQATCLNMLFLGNVQKPTCNYKELQNLALCFAVTPSYKSYNNVDHNYDGDFKNTYYNSQFIYNYTGYWPEEVYRIGMVFILSDGSNSPVFNIRGKLGIVKDLTYTPILNDDRAYIEYDEVTGKLTEDLNSNAKGIISIKDSGNPLDIIGLKIQCVESVALSKLDELQIKGWFFVRQTRIPNVVCQALTIATDKNSHTPVLPTENGVLTESFLTQSEIKGDDRYLDHHFERRLYKLENNYTSYNAAICPEYTLNQEYLNSIFLGNSMNIKTDLTWDFLNIDSYDLRHFYVSGGTVNNSTEEYTPKVIGIPDSTSLIALDLDNLFSSKAGLAEEAWRFEFIQEENKVTEATNLLRGNYSPFIGFSEEVGNKNVNLITIKNSLSKLSDLEQINIRIQDYSPYFAITDKEEVILTKEYFKEAYRGDCYIGMYTLRINRNFNDPTAPYNDKLVDTKTWRDNFKYKDKVLDTSNLNKINLGDVNAVQLGMWVTFPLRSNFNINIRTTDDSYVSEVLESGHSRSFYPLIPMTTEGPYKLPEAECFNKGLLVSVSEKYNYSLPDSPYYKNTYNNRIMYSDIHVNDAFKNGYRVFRALNYRDYDTTYGQITKLVEFGSDLICVFEKGVALIPVNERAIAGQGSGGNVFINTSNVLPENPKIISDTFGSLWADSVLKTPNYVYGVDTVAKKIWRTNGATFECISDLRVQEFLNNNISLGERELQPILGVRNVKTFYNAFKHDVMFTFYDNTYGFEEKVWNLCWNEVMDKFITFYSWVPSVMENINNIPFSFDRNTSKWIAKLGVSHSENSFADGITLSNVTLPKYHLAKTKNALYVDNFSYLFTYIKKDGTEETVSMEVDEDLRSNFIGVLSLVNRIVPNSFYKVDYTIERDDLLNYVNFDIKNIKTIVLGGEETPNALYEGLEIIIQGLYFKANTELTKFPVYYSGSDLVLLKVVLNSTVDTNLKDGDDNLYVYTNENLYNPETLLSELYYRNSAGNAYADYDTHKLGPDSLSISTINSLWIRDVKILDQIIADGILSLDTPIGNATCMSDGTYYLNKNNEPICKLDGTILKYKSGENATSSILNAPENSVIFEDSEGLVNYIYEDYQGEPKTPPHRCTTLGEIRSIITTKDWKPYFREDGTYDPKIVPYVHGIPLAWHWTLESAESVINLRVHFGLPIFKDITGKRPTLPKESQVNPNKLVTLINIKANINIVDTNLLKVSDILMNTKATYNSETSLINAGYYESVVAITPEWNLQFLTSDFWKHGLAGLIDVADDIYPTYWYGKQHPFEFECIVVNDPTTHKIFSYLELVANKAKPESFHYEIIGETYDFANDKINMYFRQEALKALWQYNGSDICYDRNFVKVQPRQLAKSADLVHTYYSRQDTLNDVEDYYISATYPKNYDYRHLSGAEIVYYKNRNEYRIWQHSKAVSLDDLSQDDARSIIAGNCRYIEDKWRITINPILICYKNEYSRKFLGALIQELNSDWTSKNRPKLPVYNSPIPDKVWENLKLTNGEVEFPPILTKLGYTEKDIDYTNWLKETSIYGTLFGEAQNRKEIDLKDRFMKVRIRYSGEELAVIDMLNTVYRLSFV